MDDKYFIKRVSCFWYSRTFVIIVSGYNRENIRIWIWYVYCLTIYVYTDAKTFSVFEQKSRKRFWKKTTFWKFDTQFHFEIKYRFVFLYITFFIMWSIFLKIEIIVRKFRISIFQIHIRIENNCLELETRVFFMT